MITRSEAIEIAKAVKLGRSRSLVQAAITLAEYILQHDLIPTYPALQKVDPNGKRFRACCPVGACELKDGHVGEHGDSDAPATNGYTLISGRWKRDERHYLFLPNEE